MANTLQYVAFYKYTVSELKKAFSLGNTVWEMNIYQCTKECVNDYSVLWLKYKFRNYFRYHWYNKI